MYGSLRNGFQEEEKYIIVTNVDTISEHKNKPDPKVGFIIVFLIERADFG